MVVDARLVSAGQVPTPESIAPYRHALVVSTYEIVNVVEGNQPGTQINVAHWGIRDSRVLKESRRPAGQVYRLTVERYDAHPELEGERLIQGDVPDAPLYYDVGAQ